MYEFANNIVTRLMKRVNLDDIFLDINSGANSNQLNEIQIKMINWVLHKSVFHSRATHFNSLTDLEFIEEMIHYPILVDFYNFRYDIANYCGNKETFIDTYKHNSYVDEIVVKLQTKTSPPNHRGNFYKMYDSNFKIMFSKKYSKDQYEFFRESVYLQFYKNKNIDVLIKCYEYLLDDVDKYFSNHDEENVYQREIIFRRLYTLNYQKYLDKFYLREVVNINLWEFENIKSSNVLKGIIFYKCILFEYDDIIELIRNNVDYFVNIKTIDSNKEFARTLRKVSNYALSKKYKDVYVLIEDTFRNELNHLSHNTFIYQIVT